jgi:uncharacterized protein (TIGR03437 family)
VVHNGGGVTNTAVAALILPLGAAHAAIGPLSFELNRGQAHPSARFLARSAGGTVWFTPSEVIFRLAGDRSGPPAVVRMRLLGADPQARLEAVEELPARSHYLVGAPERWRSSIPHYARLRYRGVYPGIDLEFYGDRGRLEYDFRIAAGADPSQIRVVFEGADSVEPGAGGDLLVRARGGLLRQHSPVAYQAGSEIPVRQVMEGRRQVAFRPGWYDRRKPLVIDPVISFATYLGGSGDDSITGLAVDPQGNVYVAGYTTSADFPIGVQSRIGGQSDAFLAKLDPAGALAYVTYLGGAGQDEAKALAVDGSGAVYVTGETYSRDFPRTPQSVLWVDSPEPRIFVVKLNPVGNTLDWAASLGSGTVGALAVDPGGNSCLAGWTSWSGFPLLRPFQSALRGTDAFVAKLNRTASALLYSSFLGGSAADRAYDITSDAEGNCYLAGHTLSQDLAVVNAADSTYGGLGDAWAAKVNTAGGLVYLTYLGGSRAEEARAIAVDVAGNAYVTGYTESPDFPTRGAPFQRVLRGLADAFVLKLNAAGNTLVYSSYLGGDLLEVASDIAVDGLGGALLAGLTGSANFPATSDAPQRNFAGISDAFLARVDPSGAALAFGSYFGGNGWEGDTPEGHVRLALYGPEVLLAGTTGSTNLPTSAGQRVFRGGVADGYIVRWGGFPTAPLQIISPAPQVQCRAGQECEIRFRAEGGCPPYTWSVDSIPQEFQFDREAAVLRGAPALLRSFEVRVSVRDRCGAAQDRAVRLTVVRGAPVVRAVVNGATMREGPLTAGEIVTLFGSNIGPPALTVAPPDASGRFPVQVAQTRVLFDGIAAPLLYVQEGQTSALVPGALAGASRTRIQVELTGETSEPITRELASSAPGIFTINASGRGAGAILNQDGALNGPDQPAPRGSVVMIFATGQGELSPQADFGTTASFTTLHRPVLPVLVRMGDETVTPLYAGSAPGLTLGLLQVNATVPLSLTPGPAVPVTLVIGSASSPPGVTLAVR